MARVQTNKAYKVTDHFTLPVDVEAIQIIPHAHYICKEMRGVAHLPDGSTRWLIKISDWDFNRQEHYRYLRPVHLPADTRLDGANLTYLHNRAVAQLLYSIGAHRVSVFVQQRPEAATQTPNHVCGWAFDL